MRIGILSDSHGRADTTRQAVAALLEHGAQMLIHLGDIGSEAVLDELVGRNARIVLGNCDWHMASDLTRYARLVGIVVDDPLGVIDVDGKRIAYTHGHLATVMRDAMAAEPDYLLHGHTHELRDQRVGKVRVINPGALFRAARYTAAVLDPSRDALEIIELAGQSLT